MTDEPSITLDELAETCGLAWRTARRRLRAAGVRHVFEDKRGRRYPKAEALHAMEAGENDRSDDELSPRERWELARAKREEYELGLIERRLIDIEPLTRGLERIIEQARNQLLCISAMPDTPQDFRPILDQRIRAALTELSRMDAAMFRDDEG